MGARISVINHLKVLDTICPFSQKFIKICKRSTPFVQTRNVNDYNDLTILLTRQSENYRRKINTVLKFDSFSYYPDECGKFA